MFEGGYVWKNVGMCLKGDMFGRMWDVFEGGICFEECRDVFEGGICFKECGDVFEGGGDLF